MNMNAYFFGYGSLVDVRTHDSPVNYAAKARNWRRVWRDLKDRDVAILTIYRRSGAEIDGLVAPVPGGDWAALDLRESAYQRIDGTAEIIHGMGATPRISLYAVAPEPEFPLPRGEASILLSYLDVVVAGYLAQFGADGVARFFDSTDGWARPVRDDRANPAYPRAQPLAPEVRALSDHHLARVGARVAPLGGHR